MNRIARLMTISEEPVVIADHRGIITYANPEFESVFGWGAGEILGKHLSVIIPKDSHDAHNVGFSRFLTTSKSVILGEPLRLRAVRKDGREFEAEHLIIAERTGGDWLFGAVIRPLGSDSHAA